MKIRNYTLTWLIVILVSATVFFVGFEYKAIQYQKESMISNKAKDASLKMNMAISEMMRTFSGTIPVYIFKVSTGNYKVEDQLADMKNRYDADWAFVTIDNKNYIYPTNQSTSSIIATSRPWFVSSVNNLSEIVGNEFYSEKLKSRVVTVSVAFQNKNDIVSGGLIFKEDKFFSMISSKANDVLFLIFKDGKVVYPTKIHLKEPNSREGTIHLNGESYVSYAEKYDDFMQKNDVDSNTGYDMLFLIPYEDISGYLNFSFLMLFLIFSITIGGGFLIFFLIAKRVENSVESLETVAADIDVNDPTLKFDPALEEKVKRFKETRRVYLKLVEMFQDVTAHIEELRATNEELESSYEDIENLSNTLALESSKLKELSESSKFIALSRNSNEAANILLEKIINIYDCEGAALFKISNGDLSEVSHQGKRFDVPSLNSVKEKIKDGDFVNLLKDGEHYLIVPILFESKLIAILIMLLGHGTPEEAEFSYISNFSAHFAAVLNSDRMIKEVQSSYIYLAEKFSEISEIYDYETGSHVHRVGTYSEFLAKELGMSKTFIEQIGKYSMVHDIGKLKVPREILMKNGPLTNEEFEEMKKHTIYGEKLLGDAPFLEMARHIARSHHEKFDGSGYPDGLKGNEIPMEARIVALADVYDALRSPRRYKRAFTHEETVKIITVGDGRTLPSHFDPDVLEVFKKYHLEFAQIYDTLAD